MHKRRQRANDGYVPLSGRPGWTQRSTALSPERTKKEWPKCPRRSLRYVADPVAVAGELFLCASKRHAPEQAPISARFFALLARSNAAASGLATVMGMSLALSVPPATTQSAAPAQMASVALTAD